jgi:hypothetical protein
MIENLYRSLERYQMLFMKAYSEKKGIKVKYTEKEVELIVRQFLLYLGVNIYNTLVNCGINPRHFVEAFSNDLRYKILTVALRNNVIFETPPFSVNLEFVVNIGFFRRREVNVGLGYHSNINCYCNYARDSKVFYKHPEENIVHIDNSEKLLAIYKVFDMITAEYLENFASLLNLIEACNNESFAEYILKLNNSLEEIILPKEDYSNPHNRSFWFRVFRRNKFKKERDKHLLSKLELAEEYIKNINYLIEKRISDITPQYLNTIKWAIDYKGWGWFYSRLPIPADTKLVKPVKPLRVKTTFHHNNG